MRLSALQKFILLQCFTTRKSRVSRDELLRFYTDAADSPKKEDQQNAVTKSLERLIDKGLMVGYGRRTPKKWFIDDVKLMASGRRAAKRLLGEQQQFPFKSRQT